jgi:hypothetical protein
MYFYFRLESAYASGEIAYRFLAVSFEQSELEVEIYEDEYGLAFGGGGINGRW